MRTLLLLVMAVALVGCMSVAGRVDVDLYGMPGGGGVYPFRNTLKGAKPKGIWVPLTLVDL
ncbi:uncharacterized protein METZ01_LOCUS196045, partial [marine metagenome]